jgi:3-deoxy-7-phosphoheptulonate synthase
MNMNFLRKLPTPLEIKELYPLSDELKKIKEQNDKDYEDFINKTNKNRSNVIKNEIKSM